MIGKKFFFTLVSLLLSIYFLKIKAQTNRVGIAQGSSIITDIATTNKILDGIVATGAGYTRIDLDWRWIQPDGPATYDWQVAEPAINAALAKGLKVIALPTYSPGWANGNTGNMQSAPVNDTYFYNLCYQAGLHYLPKGILDWELWNEANGGGMTVTNYVNRVLKPGYNALRAAATSIGINPNTINIITSGPQPAATDINNMVYAQVDWVKGIYSNGGKNYFNTVGQHPYCWPLDPSTESPYNWFKKTPELYDVMVANADANKKIWVTEVGWPTHTGTNSSSETNQALFLQKAYNMWNSWSWSGLFLVYNYWPDTTDAADPEKNFGLVRNNFSAKPSLQAYKDMVVGKVWAEAGTLSGSPVVSTTGSGWSGAGYIKNIGSATGSSVTLNIFVPTAGNYAVAFRYSNGNSGSRTLSAYLNGVDTKNISFARTGSWNTTWATVTSSFALKAGINSIKLQFDAGDGRVDIDYITVSATTAAVAGTNREVPATAKKIISCYPNSFTTTGSLQIDIPTKGKYQVSLYNTQGTIKKILLEKILSPGKYYLGFGNDLAPGIYVVEIASSSIQQTITVIKN